MQKFWAVASLSFLAFTCANPGDLTGSKEFVNIPDTVFKARLFEELQIDQDADGQISLDEAAAVLDLDMSYNADSDYGAIKDFKGIESFTNLQSFVIDRQTALVTGVDLSLNHALKAVSAQYSSMPHLLIGNQNNLVELRLRNANIGVLQIGPAPQLQMLDIQYSNNLLQFFKFSQMPNLAYLYIYKSDLGVESIDLSSNPKLVYLAYGSESKHLRVIYVSEQQQQNIAFGALSGWSQVRDIAYVLHRGL